MDVLHLGVFIHRGLDSKCHSFGKYDLCSCSESASYLDESFRWGL